MRFALFALFALTAVALPAPDKQAEVQVATPTHAGLHHPTAPSAVQPTKASSNAHEEHAVVAQVASALPVKPAEAALFGLEFEEKTTPRGKKYKVYRPKGSARAETLAKRSAYGHFTEQVYWTAWKLGTTSQRFQKVTGIEQWSIDRGGFFYSYRLNFHTWAPWNYYFEDEEGDWYHCNVILQGQHYIDYNSGKPNVVMVQGV